MYLFLTEFLEDGLRHQPEKCVMNIAYRAFTLPSDHVFSFFHFELTVDSVASCGHFCLSMRNFGHLGGSVAGNTLGHSVLSVARSFLCICGFDFLVREEISCEHWLRSIDMHPSDSAHLVDLRTI